MYPDAIEAAPDIYQVVLENDHVRVLQVAGAPGAKAQLHSHPAQVAVALTAGLYRFTDPDGQVTEAKLEPGMVMYLDPVVHATEIAGDPESRILLVELK